MNTRLRSSFFLIIAFLVIAGALPLSAELLFHEGFDYATGPLNGTGGWTASASLNVESSTSQGAGWNNDNFDGVTQIGFFAGGNNGVAKIPLDSTVTATFTDGSTTWLSWLAIQLDSRFPAVAIGTGAFGDRGRSATGQNIGGGSHYSKGSAKPGYWDPSVASGVHQTGDSVTLPTNTLPAYLMMAKIDWAANGSNDTVTLAAFASGEVITEAAFDAKVTSGAAKLLAADFNQSTFDTLNVATSRNNFFDEIRIATTFADAVSQASGDYEAWCLNFPTLGLADEDDDKDGLSNDEERIFGLDPTDPSSNNPFAAPLAPNGTFSYTRRSQSLTGMDYTVWFSTDLQTWFRDIKATQTAGTPANDVEIVGVEIDPNLLAKPKLFIRLGAEPQVTLPAP